MGIVNDAISVIVYCRLQSHTLDIYNNVVVIKQKHTYATFMTFGIVDMVI